jgi:cyclopropane-fatty-acyl-phospholipid synthase
LGAQDSSSWRLGNFEEPKVVITIQSPRALPLLISPSLESLGEAYVEGWIDVQGRIEDILEVAHRMAESGMGLWQGVNTGGKYMRQMVRQFTHTPQSDQAAIAHHYDVSNAFYQAWLDPAMVYSCAYFEHGDETLEQAQIKKIKLVKEVTLL